ncbi:hypothetical protein [Microvirga rosea]|uniref:hypothetical protein n=1 Tax=Microvirga rosea TaxID=2715425 RepID=UPI001D0B698C|nr:hypothetical protein [Microvirga rosea]MCB8823041.1 hypothetical protein [Microvirga rosea]
MAPGGVLEIIWHFAGYWHLIQDFAATRHDYDEAFYKDHSSDYRINLTDGGTLSPGILDVGSSAVHASLGAALHGSSSFPAGLKLQHQDYPHIDAGVPAPSLFRDTMEDGSALGAFSVHSGLHIRYLHGTHQGERHPHSPAERDTHHHTPTYTMSYDDPPSGVVGKLTQVNMLSDNDRFSDGREAHNIIQGLDDTYPMADLVNMGTDIIPASQVSAGQLGDFGVAALTAHDEALSSGQDESVIQEPGRYVNGVLQSQDTSSSHDASVESPKPPEPGNVEADNAQIVEAGGNKAENVALVLDFNEMPAALIVQGSYFSTNAILQANVLQNNDAILDAGSKPAVIDEGQNSTDNTATVSPKEDLQIGGYHTLRGDLKVNVDYVDGDLFDIKALTQRSYLKDGDVTIQTQMNTYAEVHSGGNEQYNVARFEDWGQNYDIIVVLGNYHSANVISQLNVVLDDDVIGLNSGSDENVTHVFSDQNNLQNEAAIHTYGTSSFSNLTGDIEQLIQSLNGRETVDRQDWSSFHGSAQGSLNVLFVTGDYYDLNIISQVNYISDPDVALQVANDQSTFQWVSTGGNAASNYAVIVDGSATSSQIIGGDVYEDSILLQANLVSDSTQTIPTDPNALVTELVAFVDHSSEAAQVDAGAWTKDIFGSQHDTFGHVLT